jgi:hypothetical protein
MNFMCVCRFSLLFLSFAHSATLRVTKKQQKWEAASSVASSSWSILNGSDGTEVEVVKDLGLSQPISVRTHLPPHRLGKPGGEIMGYRYMRLNKEREEGGMWLLNDAKLVPRQASGSLLLLHAQV